MSEGVAVLRSHLRLDDLRGDPWGTAMGWLFGVARVLDALGDVDHPVPDRWQFRRSPADRFTVAEITGGVDTENDDPDDREFPDCLVAADVLSGATTATDLVRWGNVLDRYTELCRRHGKDY